MTYQITAEELFHVASQAITSAAESQLSQFNELLQTLCNEEQNRVNLFRTLRHTRIKLSVMRERIAADNGESRFKQLCVLDVAVGYIDTELDLLTDYNGIDRSIEQTIYRWTGTLVEFVELMYGLQSMRSIDNGKIPIYEFSISIGKLFGIEMKEAVFYNTYANIKHRKGDSRTYFIDKMSECLNLRMQRDDEKESLRR